MRLFLENNKIVCYNIYAREPFSLITRGGGLHRLAFSGRSCFCIVIRAHGMTPIIVGSNPTSVQTEPIGMVADLFGSLKVLSKGIFALNLGDALPHDPPYLILSKSNEKISRFPRRKRVFPFAAVSRKPCRNKDTVFSRSLPSLLLWETGSAPKRTDLIVLPLRGMGYGCADILPGRSYIKNGFFQTPINRKGMVKNMKVIIGDNERGLLYKNGRLIKLLSSGKYHTGANSKIDKYLVGSYLSNLNCTFETLTTVKDASESLIFHEVADNEYSLHYLNGNFKSLLLPGRYAFWKAGGQHEFKKLNRDGLEIGDQVTPFELSKIPVSLYHTVSVGSHERARLYFDNKFKRMLEPGTYYFWNSKIQVTAENEDMRERQLDINGQEILAADKAGLRINFVIIYKVTDAEKIASVSQNTASYLYTMAQLVLREYVSRYKTDEILENRDKISDEVIAVLREKTRNAYVEIISAGIKDIILPGEISAIMNSVLAAEKKAQANVITRREEVASTRSLLNTAKLLDENETLRHLKELEYLERICEHVGEINVNGGSDILSRLTELVVKDNSKKM